MMHGVIYKMCRQSKHPTLQLCTTKHWRLNENGAPRAFTNDDRSERNW